MHRLSSCAVALLKHCQAWSTAKGLWQWAGQGKAGQGRANRLWQWARNLSRYSTVFAVVESDNKVQLISIPMHCKPLTLRDSRSDSVCSSVLQDADTRHMLVLQYAHARCPSADKVWGQRATESQRDGWGEGGRASSRGGRGKASRV